MEMEGTAEAIKGVWEPELLRRSLKQMGDESAELGQRPAEKDDSLSRFPEGGVSERAWSSDGGFVMQAPKGQMEEPATRRSALGIPSFRGDEFVAASDMALPEGPILWGTQAQDVMSGQTLQQAPKWESELKMDEGTAEAGKRDTGRLGTLGPLQGQGQRDGFLNAMERVGGADVLERIRQQLDDLAKSIDSCLQTGADETREATSTKRAGQQPMQSGADSAGLDSLKASPLDGLQEAADGEIEASEDELYFDEMVRETATPGSFREKSSAFDGLDGLSQADRPKAGMSRSRAERIMGSHKSLESYLEAKFNQHILAAESYLRQGRYHRAADSFALASIYKVVPGEAGSDPAHAFGLALSLAGRGHALFASGEYISSALFLSRAIEADPEYARTEIDFVTMLGGVDKLESRIADVKEWLGRSGAAELQFLLGYVYYRMGKLQEAKEAIDAAYEKMPQSPAVDTVRKAIDVVCSHNF
jgi:tetratricopeptide (TPR) repeat protein